METSDELGESGIRPDITREDDVTEAGKFCFGAELPNGDAGQGLAKDECAADAEAERGRIARGDAALGDQVARGYGEILYEVNEGVGNAAADGETGSGVGRGDELPARVDDGVAAGGEGGGRLCEGGGEGGRAAVVIEERGHVEFDGRDGGRGEQCGELGAGFWDVGADEREAAVGGGCAVGGGWEQGVLRGLTDAGGDKSGGGAVEETRAGGLGGERGGSENLNVAGGSGVDDADGTAREGAEFFGDGLRAGGP